MVRNDDAKKILVEISRSAEPLTNFFVQNFGHLDLCTKKLPELKINLFERSGD